PKKTWEGYGGGIIITLLLSVLLGYIYEGKENLDFIHWIVLGVIVVVFGSIGDLVESMLKRSVKTKDSGNILPGHGGILDRFDAFIFLLPFAAAYLLYIRA
ncbi:MAG: phosphatidate cytidylyltransferase, partial [Bacteroidota bacterium]